MLRRQMVKQARTLISPRTLVLGRRFGDVPMAFMPRGQKIQVANCVLNRNEFLKANTGLTAVRFRWPFKLVFDFGAWKLAMAIDLFTPIVAEDRLHAAFKGLAHRGFEPARRMLAGIAATFRDKDGNFVKDFQTTGFDARLWELYLHAYLRSDEFNLDETKAVPDYIATKAARTVLVEAVTVNPTEAKTASEAETAGSGLNGWDLFSHRMQNVYPIKFGSPLFSKMKKKYWEQEHVRGNPFVLAIEDFHEPGSMVWTGSALELYLYGHNYEWYHRISGELVVVPEAIGHHRHGKKQIPSGFFEQPDAEHVSAVLFSNSATISKFNRMGFLAGYRPEGLTMIRAGACYNHEPHATEPLEFMYVVGDPSAPAETWAEGLSMFHNPSALEPVPQELFPGIAHHWLDDRNRMRSVVPAFHPYGSFTQILNGVPDATVLPAVSKTLTQMLKGKPPVSESEGELTGASSSVRRISRAEYRSHRVTQGPVMAPVLEKSWFSNEKGLIGTVFVDLADKDWNYVVLAPDAEEVYRWVAGNGGMDTQEEAEQSLSVEMRRL
jgi:hypothetical protein